VVQDLGALLRDVNSGDTGAANGADMSRLTTDYNTLSAACHSAS
jgi:hypothetical protein